MSIPFTVARKDIREVFRNKSIYVYIAFLFLISFPYLEGLRSTLGGLTEQSSNVADIEEAARSFLDVTVYTLPMTLSMLFCTYLSAYAIILEKAKKSLESLLATPASLKQVWLGKTTAVTLPSVAITLLVLVAGILVLNFAVIVPQTGSFVLPNGLPLVTGLVIIPLVAFGVVAAVSILQLTMSNPRIANFVFIAMFFGFYMMTITEFSASWDFWLIYLVTIVVLIVANLVLSRFLTKERVVLSSKG
ncbi:MAG: hypothetical protein A2147_00800 [Chloroflexi bacterium RBG_16_57_8]|nr:MAG: hypothetical protein A2147_00800 [Chloroflexi bacterium RBG_16_57_8]